MASKAQKIRVGAFVVVSLTLLAVVLIVFGGMRFWEKHATYQIVFAGSVMGLEKGAPVHLNGMRIGRVDEIGVAPDDLEKVLVKVAIKKGTPVRTDTRALLQFAGITGLKVIDLRGGTLSAAVLPEGSTILEGEGILDKLEKQAKEIVDQSTGIIKNANQVVSNLVVITDPKKYEGIDEVIAHAKVMSRNLETTSTMLQGMVTENRAMLRSSLASVDAASKNVEAATKNIETATASASTIMEVQVAGLVGKAGELLGGLGAIVRSNEGQLRASVFDLRQASRNFKELSRDLRQRPSRLLFSTPPAQRKLP